MKNIKVILGVIIVGALIGLGFFFITEKNSGQSNSEQSIETNSKDLINLDLDEILVNLKDSSSYMKTSISIGYNKKNKDIESKVPIIRDVIISYLMSKTSEDFDSNNLINIKDDIKNKINEELQANIVEKIYFTSLVIQ